MIARYFDYHMSECDCCGRFLPAEQTDEAAEAAMRAAGWEKRDGVDICPICLRKEQETGTLPGRQLFWRFTEHIWGSPRPSQSRPAAASALTEGEPRGDGLPRRCAPRNDK